jgi:hypothetical protein
LLHEAQVDFAAFAAPDDLGLALTRIGTTLKWQARAN